MTKDIGYKIVKAEAHDFCLLCKGPADQKLVGAERTFRFCQECGTAFAALMYQAFGRVQPNLYGALLEEEAYPNPSELYLDKEDF